MNYCAEGPKRVEKLIGYGKTFYRDSMAKFLEDNKPSLSSILVANASYRDAEKESDELLDSFLDLPALEELVLNF